MGTLSTIEKMYRLGFSDRKVGKIMGESAQAIRNKRAIIDLKGPERGSDVKGLSEIVGCLDDGMSNEEIAQVMELPVEAIETIWRNEGSPTKRALARDVPCISCKKQILETRRRCWMCKLTMERKGGFTWNTGS